MIGDENLQRERCEHEQRRHQVAIEAGDQFRHFAHCGDVGRDIEHIGDQQKQHDALKNDRWERRFDIGGESPPGDPADARAHRLDRRHQGIGERHRPQHVKAELRARLRIGGYAARVVVGHAGDQPRSEPRQRVFLQATPKEPDAVRSSQPIDPALIAPHGFDFPLV